MLQESSDSYRFPDVIRHVTAHPERVVDAQSGLPEGDLAFAAHLGKYFNREFAETLRETIRSKKRIYDNEGGENSPKTPFALRNITDPSEREFVIGNITSFATTQGCTGGCKWCGFDAFPTDDIEVTPLAQKEHFFDELYGLAMSVDPNRPDLGRAAIKDMQLFADNDPFDDPDIVELVTYLSNTYGSVPYLSTVIPERGRENFLQLAAAAKRHRDLRTLRTFSGELARLEALAKQRGITDMAEFVRSADRQRFLPILKRLAEVLDMIASLSVEDRKIVLLTNGCVYNEVLAFFGLGKIDDYVEMDDGKKKAFADVIIREEAVPSGHDADIIVDLLKRAHDETLKAAGFFGVEGVDFGEESRASILEAIRALSESLDGVPDPGNIRVSVVGRKLDFVSELLNSGKHHFVTDEPTRKSRTGLFIPTVAGKSFFESGEEGDAEFGISCQDGMRLSPFGLFNSVTGEITHDYPQGRVIVPYGGLVKGGQLSSKGDDLGKVLKNVVVIHGDGFSGQGPSCIRVYDGNNRIRKIDFDRRTYKVVDDKVEREGVVRLTQVMELKKGW